MKHARVVLHTHPAHVVPGRSIMLRDPLISASVCRTRGAWLASRSSQCAARIAHRTARSLPLASHSSHHASHSSHRAAHSLHRAARSTQLDHQPYYCVQPLFGILGFPSPAPAQELFPVFFERYGFSSPEPSSSGPLRASWVLVPGCFGLDRCLLLDHTQQYPAAAQTKNGESDGVWERSK